MNWNLAKQSGTTLTDTEGNVYSLNPSAHPGGTAGAPYYFTKRPPGTNLAYEQCAIAGGCVTYSPLGTDVIVYGWQPLVPNTGGFGAISQEPLA